MATAVSTCRSAPSSSASGVATNSVRRRADVLDNFRVAAFYDDHGVDLRVGLLDAALAATTSHRVEATDPWRLAVQIPLAEAELTAYLDGDLQPVEFERLDCVH